MLSVRCAFAFLLLSCIWGCDSNRGDAVSHLPTCARACTADPPATNAIEVRAGQYRVWPAGVDDRGFEASAPDVALDELRRLDGLVSSQLGLRAPQVLLAMCGKKTPFAQVSALLTDPKGTGYTALGLGGQRGNKAWYATVRVWRGEDVKKGIETGALVEMPSGGLSEVKACGGRQMEACPVVLVAPAEGQTCGDVVGILEEGATSGRLFALWVR